MAVTRDKRPDGCVRPVPPARGPGRRWPGGCGAGDLGRTGRGGPQAALLVLVERRHEDAAGDPTDRPSSSRSVTEDDLAFVVSVSVDRLSGDPLTVTRVTCGAGVTLGGGSHARQLAFDAQGGEGRVAARRPRLRRPSTAAVAGGLLRPPAPGLALPAAGQAQARPHRRAPAHARGAPGARARRRAPHLGPATVHRGGVARRTTRSAGTSSSPSRCGRASSTERAASTRSRRARRATSRRCS